MLMKKVFFALLSLIFFGGCVITETIFPKATEIPPSGTVLLSETFSSVDSGWPVINQNGSFVIYQADGLRFLIEKSNLDLISSPGFRFSDVRVEVEAIKIDGPDNNTYGIICRRQDDKNYYAFVISSDGYTGIIKVVEGNYQLINGTTLEFAPAVNQGRSINYLSATCQGNMLSFNVNGEKQFDIQDDQFTQGSVGLIAGSFDEPGVDIFFDNLTVFQP